MTTKRIGILTSGGDCPGLNAVIRAVVSHANLTYGWEVLGIPYGTQGLGEAKSVLLNSHGLGLRGLDPLLNSGGTILGSINKGDTLGQADRIIAGYHALGLDALIAIGGDGSLNIIRQIIEKGNLKMVGVPKTIDNDVALTEKAVGFDTAVNTVTEALYRLSFTAASHDRVMVVEVMGRDAGHLALHSGIAGGADVILIPEIPYSIEQICKKITAMRDLWDRLFAIVVVAEGAKTSGGDGESRYYTDALGETRLRGIGEYVADQITRCSGKALEARVTVLGHTQRGGAPSAFDRLLATAFGKAAVDLIAQDQYDQMVAWNAGRVTAVPLADVVGIGTCKVALDNPLLDTARAIGTYMGEF